MKEMKQFRSIDMQPNMDVVNNECIVSGYALVFNKLSGDVGGYREMIIPGAVNEDIINKSDIFCYIDHEGIKGVLERSRYGKGGLELIVDETGLLYRFKLGNSPICSELKHYLERKIITKSSFSFTIAEYKWLDDEKGDPVFDDEGLQQMSILKFDRLFDVSPVFEPAYTDTSVSMNNKDIGNPLFITECKERKAQYQKPSEDYYINLRKKYKI